jgi:hypothetical protein
VGNCPIHKKHNDERAADNQRGQNIPCALFHTQILALLRSRVDTGAAIERIQDEGLVARLRSVSKKLLTNRLKVAGRSK